MDDVKKKRTSVARWSQFKDLCYFVLRIDDQESNSRGLRCCVCRYHQAQRVLAEVGGVVLWQRHRKDTPILARRIGHVESCQLDLKRLVEYRRDLRFPEGRENHLVLVQLEQCRRCVFVL